MRFLQIPSVVLVFALINNVCAATAFVRSLPAEAFLNSDELLENSLSGKSPAQAMIGRGYDSLLGDPKHISCVELNRGVADLPSNPTVQHTSQSFTHITDETSLAESTGLTASAAYNWGGNKADARASYFYSSKMTAYKSYALQTVNVSYDLPEDYGQEDFHLTDIAKKILAIPGGDAIFRYACGDRFVIGFQYGGLFSASISAEAKTNQEQHDLDVAIQASQQTGSESVDLKNTYESLERSSNLQIDVMRDGTEEQLPKLDLASLSDYATQYPAKIAALKQKPILGVDTADYLPILIREAHKQLGPTPAWATEISNQFNYLLRLTKYMGDLTYIRDHRDEFVPFDERLLETRLSDSNAAIQAVTAWALECIRTRGASCQDLSNKNLMLSKYSPLRAEKWVSLDPRSDQIQPIGESLFQPMTVEVRGYWYYGKWVADHAAATTSTELHITDRSTNQERVISSVPTLNVPQNQRISFRFADQPGNYGDNSTDTNDPARARLGGALDDFFAGK